MAKSEGKPKDRSEKRDNYKTRNWVTVVYPESEKPNWRETLRSWCVQAFVSPIHDKDTNQDGDQTPKKPHYHVLIMWDGPATRGAMEKRVAELGGVGCQPCNSARGYARYLCHLDNPEKAQYDPGAVEAFGGADYMEVIALESDRRATIAEMQAWCDEQKCVSFAALCREARANRPVWWQALCAHSTMIMFRYVRSLEEELEKEAKEAREAYSQKMEDNALRWGRMSDEERVAATEEEVRKAQARLERLKEYIHYKAGAGEAKEGGDCG